MADGQASWERRAGDYSAAQLRTAFGVHGTVADVVLVQSKKKAKGSALVQFETLQAALAAGQVSPWCADHLQCCSRERAAAGTSTGLLKWCLPSLTLAQTLSGSSMQVCPAPHLFCD